MNSLDLLPPVPELRSRILRPQAKLGIGSPAAGILRLLVVLMTLAAAPARAFFCDQDIVSEGLTKAEVFQKCGPPSFEDSRIEYRTAAVAPPGYPQIGVGTAVPLTIDEWTYNFGSNRFMQLLVFENGRLRQIRSLGYGR